MIVSINAYNQILKKNKKLSILVENGGCLGFSFIFDYIENQNNLLNYSFYLENNNLLIDNLICTDSISKTFLNNSFLDYVHEIGNEDFVITNPNFKLKCGCGSSFGLF